MARHRRRPSDSPGDDPNPRNRPGPDRPTTDLSAFLDEPLGSIDDPAFDLLCRQMLAALQPGSPVEDEMARQILSAYHSIRRGARAVSLGIPGTDRHLKSMLRSFRSRLECFDLFRRAIKPMPTPPPPPPSPPPQARSSPDPAPAADSPEPDEPDIDAEVDEIETAAREWRKRIAMVPSIDARWPVLDGLGLLVDDILTRRDRGTPEDELLECHPGLTYSDLASCYACEADGYRGPLEPPYPEDLAVIDDDPDDD